jgi:hypothetical protein
VRFAWRRALGHPPLPFRSDSQCRTRSLPARAHCPHAVFTARPLRAARGARQQHLFAFRVRMTRSVAHAPPRGLVGLVGVVLSSCSYTIVACSRTSSLASSALVMTFTLPSVHPSPLRVPLIFLMFHEIYADFVSSTCVGVETRSAADAVLVEKVLTSHLTALTRVA